MTVTTLIVNNFECIAYVRYYNEMVVGKIKSDLN